MTSAFLNDLNLPTPGISFSRWVSDLIQPVNGMPDAGTSPNCAARYLWDRRQTILDSVRQRPLIRVADKNLNVMAELEGEISASYEELTDDTGQCTIKIRYANWITDWMIHQTTAIEDLHILIDPIATNPTWETRWGGKIDKIIIKHDDQGVHTVEIHALSHREHAKKLLVGANPLFAPEVQLPRMWVLGGPCRSIIALTMFINLARLFDPLLSIPTNIFNPAGWINPVSFDVIGNLNPLNWPIQVAFVNPLLDQSRWTSIGAQWNDWHSVFKDVILDAGVQMRAYTWLTTDETSPHTELADIVTGIEDVALEFIEAFIPLGGVTGAAQSAGLNNIADLSRPTRNCIVFSLEDKSGRTGPTGTAVDGLLNLFGVTLDDLITPITVDLGRQNILDPGQVLNGEPIEEAGGTDQSYFFEQLLDVAPAPPKVIWWAGDYNGLITTDFALNKGAVKTVMTGSKSPSIINQAQTFAIKYALSQLSVVISDQIGQTYQTPGSVGLDNLYQGQLDNVLFAWQRFTDPLRAIYSGDFAWNEVFEKGSGTAYVLAAVLTLRAGNWKTRTFESFKVTTMNGHPWLADVDFVLGDRLGFEEEGTIYVDQCFGIKREWDRQKAMTVTLTIGSDKDRGDPFAAAFRTLANIWTGVSQLAGQGTLFQ